MSKPDLMKILESSFTNIQNAIKIENPTKEDFQDLLLVSLGLLEIVKDQRRTIENLKLNANHLRNVAGNE